MVQNTKDNSMIGRWQPLAIFTLLVGITVFTLACGPSEQDPARPQFDSSAPATPSGLQIRADGDCLELLWNANTTDPDLAGYVVYRSSSLESGYVLVDGRVNTNLWVDSSVSTPESYYRVAAIDAASNQSALSAPIGFVTKPLTASFSPSR